MRELHFVDIVEVQQLLEVMAHDAAPVAERIQRLLLPSYFPGSLSCFFVVLNILKSCKNLLDMHVQSMLEQAADLTHLSA